MSEPSASWTAVACSGVKRWIDPSRCGPLAPRAYRLGDRRDEDDRGHDRDHRLERDVEHRERPVRHDAERDDRTEPVDHGFETVGPLRVWLHGW